jgi:hypothetical protein
LAVVPGCGILIEPDNEVGVSPGDLAGPGLTTHGDCGLKIDYDCGLTLDGNNLEVNPSDLAGTGLGIQTGGGNCELKVQVSCGLTIADDFVRVDPNDLAGAGLSTEGDCGLRVNYGCGLKMDGDALEVDPTDLAGTGLTTEPDCNLALDDTSVSTFTFYAFIPGSLDIDMSSGCNLDITFDIEEITLHQNAAGFVVDVERDAPIQEDASFAICEDIFVEYYDCNLVCKNVTIRQVKEGT